MKIIYEQKRICMLNESRLATMASFETKLRKGSGTVNSGTLRTVFTFLLNWFLWFLCLLSLSFVTSPVWLIHFPNLAFCFSRLATRYLAQVWKTKLESQFFFLCRLFFLFQYLSLLFVTCPHSGGPTTPVRRRYGSL